MVSKLLQLQEFVSQLRDSKKGDPWICKQNFKSLIDLTIEEAYELADSVESMSSHAFSGGENDSEICDELGDLLLHIFLYAKIAEERKAFNLEDIANHSLEKQKRRKLYFNNPAKISAKEAIAQWEENKQKEREEKSKDKNKSTLDGITRTIPGLNRALILQSQAARVGFDWPSIEPVFEKLREELEEIEEVLGKRDDTKQQQRDGSTTSSIKEQLTDEIGDLLFTCINISRHFNIHPEQALRHANNKFEKRFRCVEDELRKRGKKPEESSLEEMDEIWDKVK